MFRVSNKYGTIHGRWKHIKKRVPMGLNGSRKTAKNLTDKA